MLRDYDIVTYEQLEAMLYKHGECCLIGIPGVGKTRISMHFAEKHNLNTLVITPRTEINNRWRYWGSKTDKGSISTITIQNFYKSYAMFVDGIDLYIFDECHCLGAKEWGKSYDKFKDLIDTSKCYILGLSATPNRYFDEGYAVNNIGETVFNNHIVYCMGREEAISLGLIGRSKYVCALYDVGELKREYSKKKMTEELRGRLDYSFKNQPQIRDILIKHAPKNSTKKGIVYVDKIDSIDDGINAISMAFPDEKIWSVHSKMSKSKCNRICSEFENTESGFIVNVDILSEGVHYEGVNMIIMLRKTFSPTKFTQQTGRASNTEESVIFDFAANAISVNKTLACIGISKTEFLGLGNGASREVSISNQEIIADYASDFLTILQDIDIYNGKRWTKEEDEFLRQNYLTKPIKEIADHLGRTEAACLNRASAILGIYKNSPWTKEEDEYLRQNYATKSIKEIAEHLRRTEAACKLRANKGLGVKKGRTDIWTKEEDEYLRQNYYTKSIKEIAEHLGRTEAACMRKASKLGIYKNSPWTKEEDEYLRQNYATKSIKEIAEHLGRTGVACQTRANILAIKKERAGIWTKEEDEYLRQNCCIKSYKEIAEHLGRTEGACKSRASKLGITKK